MQIRPLKKLLQGLEKEMLRLGYTEGSLKFYRKRWEQLIEFANQKGEIYYTEKSGIDFIEKYFQILEKDFEGTLTQAEVQNIRIIRMIGDFQLHNTILRRYYKHKEILTDPYFIEVNNHFKSYCKTKDYSSVTIDHYVKQAARFFDYAISQKIKSCMEITLTLINNYIKTIAGYTYKTVEQILCALRALFRFLYLNNKIETDFSKKIPMIQTRKQTRIPSVWTKEDLKKLIDAIDLGNPMGKRDYAIILLACQLGLRCKDIKNLTIDNFHWEEKKLVYFQSKTRTIETLPLTPELGWVIIDYLKYGRPKVNSKYVFIRYLAPFQPFSEGNHLNQIIKKYMRLAHLPVSKKKKGMHSLRHTLASVLLEHNTPLPVISDVLGHIDIESTAVYLKVDIKKLKECPLELQEE
ncbi:MAG: site-specific integrase [Chitinispirillia bacterium]